MSTSETGGRPVRFMLTMIVKNEGKIMGRCLAAASEVRWGVPGEDADAGRRLVDAVCLVDTGSADDTKEVVSRTCASLGLPCRIVDDPWLNFGHNRSRSFLRAVEFGDTLGWDRAASFALLLDADMVLKIGPGGFGRTAFGESGPDGAVGATFMQRAGQLEYFNVRLARLDKPWTCVGATHEYWTPQKGTPVTITPDRIFIQDVGDGGSKADKFERDIRLLTEEIRADPTNVRAHFYLAQSYHHCGRHEEAVAAYQKRIDLGGWWEERWYAKLALGRVLIAMNRVYEAECWLQRAAEENKERAEPLVELATLFRVRGDNLKAAHYARAAAARPPPSQGLFVEVAAHTHRPIYERTILDYYVLRSTSPAEAMRANLRYLCASPNAEHCESAFQNLRFYIEPIQAMRVLRRDPRTQQPWFPSRGEFIPSSVSILPRRSASSLPRLANVRYVNYRMAPRQTQDGKDVYTDMHGATCRPVETRNAIVALDPVSLMPLGEDFPPAPFWGVHVPAVRESIICGLEDVRLHGPVGDGSEVQFTATQRQWTPEKDCYRVVTGRISLDDNRTTQLTVLESPENRECEKNWIVVEPNHCSSPFGLGQSGGCRRPSGSADTFASGRRPPSAHIAALAGLPSFQAIYGWGPELQVAQTDADAGGAAPSVSLTTKASTPWLWRKFRGSSNPARFGGLLYFVVHFKYYDTPTKSAMTYAHAIVALDASTLAPRRTSQPFYFAARDNVEYCLALDVTPGGVARMWFSSRDSDPALASVALDALEWISHE
jgi:tetratricopeptide (TPR) repeat protein